MGSSSQLASTTNSPGLSATLKPTCSPRITPSASSKELQVLAQGTRYASPASAPTLRRSPTSPLVPVTPGMFDDTSGLAPVTGTSLAVGDRVVVPRHDCRNRPSPPRVGGP